MKSGPSALQRQWVSHAYDVAAEATTPDLMGLSGVSRVETSSCTVVTTYHDTAELRLLAARVSLYRRTGGQAHGWNLDLPELGRRRTQVRLPPGEADGTVPLALVSRIRVLVRDSSLVPVLVVTTRRTVHRLLAADGRLLVQLHDDRLRAEDTPGAKVVQSWREWVCEAHDASPHLVRELDGLLKQAGARSRPAGSPAARVLQSRQPSSPRWPVRTELAPRRTVGAVLRDYVTEHLVRLQEQDQLFRDGDPEGIHQLRVAARRLRSVLATYAPVLEPGVARWLREELGWFGGALGRARDAEVLRMGLRGMFDALPTDPGNRPAQDRVDEELMRRLSAGRREAATTLDSTRYFRLLDGLEDFVTAPPFTEAAHHPGTGELTRLIERELRRVHDKNRDVEESVAGTERDVALHELRKAAKRLRYAAESSLPTLGEPALQLSRLASSVQGRLGDYQDTVMARQLLRQMAEDGRRAGEDPTPLVRLVTAEQHRAQRAEEEAAADVAALLRRPLATWLRT